MKPRGSWKEVEFARTKDWEAPVGLDLYVVPTGEWRAFRPMVDRRKCCKCGNCLIFCPTQCIRIYDSYLEADLTFCKGCGICAYECPSHAITMVEEVKEV